MPGKEIKGRSARANYSHGGRTGYKHAGLVGKLLCVSLALFLFKGTQTKEWLKKGLSKIISK